MWCEALAEGFGGLGEVALTGCEGRGGADGELKRVESGTRGYWNSAACADGRDHGDGLGSGGGDASPGIPGSSAAENRGRGFERGGRGMRGRGRGSGRGGGRGANGLLADGGMRGLGTRLAMFMPPDMESG